MVCTTLSSRDIADRVGSTLGTVTGTAAALYLAHEGYSALSLNGQSVPSSKITDLATAALTAGLGSNLFRHAAVGTHDLAKHCFDVAKAGINKCRKSKDSDATSQESEEKPKNFREIADKIGSVAGSALGFVIIGYLVHSGSLSALSFNGQKILESEITTLIASVMTVGSCTNYARNASIGLHDIAKLAKWGSLTLYGKAHSLFGKITEKVRPESLPLIQKK